MTKTSQDVCTHALRLIGVCGVGDDPSADDKAIALDAMQGGLDELADQHGITVAWTVETVPDELFLPFATFVAAEIAPVYRFQGPNRAKAIGRMRASLLPDDREDRRDTDDNGTITDEEIAADQRAAYY
jgi:hypothetical protein